MSDIATLCAEMRAAVREGAEDSRNLGVTYGTIDAWADRIEAALRAQSEAEPPHVRLSMLNEDQVRNLAGVVKSGMKGYRIDAPMEYMLRFSRALTVTLQQQLYAHPQREAAPAGQALYTVTAFSCRKAAESAMVDSPDDAVKRCLKWCGDQDKCLVQLAQAAPVGVERGWQPIESAPTNYDEVLCYKNHDYFTAYYQVHNGGTNGHKAGEWYAATGDGEDRVYPTHWMPLPAAPAAPAAGTQEGNDG